MRANRRFFDGLVRVQFLLDAACQRAEKSQGDFMEEDIVKERAKSDECRTCLAITIKSVKGKQRRRPLLDL